ncbi:MAG: hypothetical protein ACYTKD_29335 [Planctomycetota bacterium]|jgi:hypothetical protein
MIELAVTVLLYSGLLILIVSPWIFFFPALCRVILFWTWGISRDEAVEAARRHFIELGWEEWWDEPSVVEHVTTYRVLLPQMAKPQTIVIVDARDGHVRGVHVPPA